jgi:hypothetical protein
MYLDSKKGNMSLDGLTVLLIIVLFIIVLPTIYMTLAPIISNFSGQFSGEDLTTFNRFTSKIDSLIDFGLLFLLIGLFVTLIISSFLIDSHPIFFGISLLFFLGVLLATVLISGFGSQYLESIGIGDSNLPISTWIASHIIQIVLVSGFIDGIVLYSKNRIGSGT